VQPDEREPRKDDHPADEAIAQELAELEALEQALELPEREALSAVGMLALPVGMAGAAGLLGPGTPQPPA